MDIVILVGFGLVMYLVLFLPQQRKAKEHRQLLASLSEGDEVVTSSGVYGFVNALDDDVIWLDVADGVELRVAKSAVASKVIQPSVKDEESNE